LTILNLNVTFPVSLSSPRALRLLAVCVSLIHAFGAVRADIVINEVVAAASDRLLQWDAAGNPRVGTGTPWQGPTYNDAGWQTGAGPLGYGTFSNGSLVFGTNVATQMQYLTPTLYLRKTFTVSADDALRTESLQLPIVYNDGFICYINGVEVARRWAGPARQFHYRDQPAYNPDLANTATNPGNLYTETVNLGAANTRLIAGENVIAIHALNWSVNSANLAVRADLRIAAGTLPAVPLVTNTDQWKYFPGVVEPSAGLFDPALLFSGKLNVPWGRGSFDDQSWGTGPGPIRAGAAGAGTVVPNVIGQTPSIYARTVFNVTPEQAAETGALQLLVDYDDGFVAYINGVEVARANLGNPNTFTPTTAVASATRNFGSQVTYVIDPPAKLLVPGQNVLAIQVHNSSINDADVYLRADLRTSTGTFLALGTGEWKYLAGIDEPLPPDTDVADELPEEPESANDWVELHNNGPEAVSLNGWSLTDSSGNRNKWIFPDVTIPAGGYLVVICDGRDLKTNPGGYLHTNFSLAGEGEFLGLYNAAGEVVDRFIPAFPRASAFHSYGRNASGEYVYFETPTPGAANAGTAASGLVADPVFSVPGGFYTTNQSVTLSSATPGATIRYTTNGSEPTLTNGVTYSAAIGVNSTTNRSLRARAFKDGMVPSRVVTSNIVIGESAARRSLPGLFLTADPGRSLYRPYGVFAIVNNDTASNYNSGIWHAQGNPLQYFNPALRGRFIERPGNMELLYPSGTPGFNMDFGLRAAGSGYSRPRYTFPWLNEANPNSRSPWASSAVEKPQMNVFFRGDLGGGQLEFPLFGNDKVTTFDNLRLRAGKNDISNPWVRDELMRRLFRDTGQIGARGINTTLWINGVYKGYFNVTERLREDFFQRWYDSENPWDVWVVNDVASGDSLMLQEMITFLRTNSQTSLANYQGALSRIDMVNFADYMIVNLYGATGDWPHNNYTMARERTPNGRWICALWDAEGAFGTFGGLTVRSNQFTAAGANSDLQGGVVGSGASSPSENVKYTLRTMYTLLRVSPEFRLLMADRIQKHFFNGGALTDANVFARKEALRIEMQPLIPSFSDAGFNSWINGQGPDRTRFTTSPVVNSPSRRTVLLNGYFDDTLGGTFVQAHFRQEGLWPATLAPEFSQFGGNIAQGAPITISLAAGGTGTIYYTTNGVDPRAPGGAVQGAEIASGGTVSIGQTTVLKARVLNGSVWSPLVEATFNVVQPPPILITEIMYHPADGAAVNGDEFEFIELKNVGTASVNLNGMQLTEGVTFEFPPGFTLAPGAFAVVVRNQTQFALRYPGVAIAGVYSGELPNSGSLLVLRDLGGNALFSTAYSDTSPWPSLADGFGNSLVPVNPNSNPAPGLATNWRASAALGGSPGADDPTPTTPAVLVNEVLSNSPAGQKDRVELFNPTPAAADVGGWFLSDNNNSPKKFRIPDGTVIPAGGFVVFSEDDFAGGGTAFAFDGNGEEVWLSAADSTGTLTGYAHGFEFDAAGEGVSFGRYVNSAGIESFPGQISQTFGAANSGPLVGPVIITEVMYAPGTGGDEFVEIRNTTNSPVSLWDPLRPSNSWRIGGISYTLPTGTVLQPRQIALITPLTPASWRAKYGTPSAVQLFGPYAGNLDNAGERVAVQYPGAPYTNNQGQMVIPYIDVDGVTYTPTAPWPAAANGTGVSLERVNWRAYGDDPANWRVSTATGGTPGIPSKLNFASWKEVFFNQSQLGDANISGPNADPDADGQSNLREYAQGSDPMSGSSSEAITTSVANDGSDGPYLHMHFRRSLAAENVQFLGDTSGTLSSWSLGSAVQAGSPVNNGDGTETISLRDTVPTTGAENRFIRLRIIGN
jgi:hypothetical protein